MTCAGAVLRGLAAQAGIAVAARRDGANDDPLTLFVVRHGGTKLFDDADRFVPDGQAFADGILALEDVNIGAADRGRGDTHQRIQGTDVAELALFEDRATGRTIVVCALDNLGKGAAGQAIQNANLALGLEETAGLRLGGVLV